MLTDDLHEVLAVLADLERQAPTEYLEPRVPISLLVPFAGSSDLVAWAQEADGPSTTCGGPVAEEAVRFTFRRQWDVVRMVLERPTVSGRQ